MAWKRKSWDPQTDRYWGPFTYNSASRSKRIALELYSPGDESESGKAGLRLSLGRRTLILALPKWVCPPAQVWVPLERHPCGKRIVTRGGCMGYWERQFGFSLVQANDRGYDFLTVHYGQQTHSSNDTKSWSWFLPWKQWRMVRHTFYDTSGVRVAYEAPCPGPKWDTPAYDLDKKAKDAVPRRFFAFLDYDGEHLYATTYIEEREWRRGEGWWKWVGRFSEPLVRRSLDIWFSGETGKLKGSWKGGTIGHSINLQPGEFHMGGFMRYCQENGMRFLFEVDEIPPKPAPESEPLPEHKTPD